MIRAHHGPVAARNVVGYVWMCVAVLIWAGWQVLTASGRTTSLSVVDLAWLRSAIPTAVLAPLLWALRAEVARLGALRCLLLSLYGAPFTLCVGFGLTHAPVAHAGALVPGLMPIFATALGVAVLGDRSGPRQLASSALVLAGAIAILLAAPREAAEAHIGTGHALFVAGALFWACFTVTVRTSDVSSWLATAVVGAVSTTALTPIWLLSDMSRIGAASLSDIAFQSVFQGVVSGLVSLFAFGQALRLLSAKAAALSALVPGVAALLAVPLLGQLPAPGALGALVLVTAGLVVGASWRGAAPAGPARSGGVSG